MIIVVSRGTVPLDTILLYRKYILEYYLYYNSSYGIYILLVCCSKFQNHHYIYIHSCSIYDIMYDNDTV